MVVESPGKLTQKGPGKSWKTTFSVLYAPCTFNMLLALSLVRLQCFDAVGWVSGRTSDLRLQPQQRSWLTVTAWWQHAVSKSAALLLSQEGSSLEAGGQGSPCSHHSVTELSWQHTGSLYFSVTPKCYTIQPV